MTADRNRGWIAVVALGLVTVSLSVVQPAILVFVPLALLLVALPPRRPIMLAFSIFVLWLVFRGAPAGGPVWFFERGWSLTLGAWFVLVVSLTDGWRHLTRSMTAVIATAVTMCLLVAVNRGGLTGLDEAVKTTLSTALGQWSQAMGEGQLTDAQREAFATVTAFLTDLYPALLGLASVAALGLAWWAYNRAAYPDTVALGRWQDLRFPDGLIWLLIAGLIAILLPVDPLTRRAGSNVLLFMAGLYAVRGAAVLSVLAAPGPLGYVLGAVLVVLMFPFVMATTLLVGLSDTWLDLRARRTGSPGPGS